MKPLSDDDRNSLQRLIKVAKSNTPQGRPIANFLLAWWNAKKYGGFDFTELWGVDKDLVGDIINVLRIIAIEQSYPAALGYEDDFTAIIEHWRLSVGRETKDASKE
jgi:hypothetical protein